MGYLKVTFVQIYCYANLMLRMPVKVFGPCGVQCPASGLVS